MYVGVIDAPELFQDRLRYPFAVLLTLDCVRIDDFHGELAHRALEFPVAVSVVGTKVASREPRWLCIRNARRFVDGKGFDDGFFASNSPDLKSGILWPQEDLIAMQSEECLRSIFPGYLQGVLVP